MSGDAERAVLAEIEGMVGQGTEPDEVVRAVVELLHDRFERYS